MRIIIVDDNIEFLDNLKHFVSRKLSHNVVATFSDGLSFLNEISKFQVDLILMDISLPGIDGYELMRLISNSYSRFKIIAITFFNEKAYLDKLLDYSCKGCVYKSDVFNELPEAIDTVMKGGLYFPDEIQIKAMN